MRFKDFLQSVSEAVHFDENGRSESIHDYEAWMAAVKASHPEFAAKMQFKSNVALDQIEAVVRGKEKVFGIWKGDDDGEGLVLEDLRQPRKNKKVDFGLDERGDRAPRTKRINVGLGYRTPDAPNPEDYRHLKDMCVSCGTDRGAHQFGTLACPTGEYTKRGFEQYSTEKIFTTGVRQNRRDDQTWVNRAKSK
jgi:hypothetical protein